MDLNDYTNVFNIDDYRVPEREYPVILPELVRQELIECGYDPNSPADIDEYWKDLLEG